MLAGHGWLQIPWLQILALNGLSLTPGWNMGLEIVAIHPNSGGTWRRPAKKRAERRSTLSPQFRDDSRHHASDVRTGAQRFCEIVLEFLAE
jgi:hypothetical protein